MTDQTDDKLLFRQTRYPMDQAATLPPDLQWALGEPEYITGGVGGGKSTLGSITFSDSPTPYEEDNPASEPGEPQIPRVPTPIINGVASSEVYQTMEGVSKADVHISVEGMEGVEYEVVVSSV